MTSPSTGADAKGGDERVGLTSKGLGHTGCLLLRLTTLVLVRNELGLFVAVRKPDTGNCSIATGCWTFFLMEMEKIESGWNLYGNMHYPGFG